MAELTRQCSAAAPNTIGKLAEVTDGLKAAGVNILAMAAWGEGDVARIMLVADDPQKACENISPVVDECGWDDVVRVTAPNSPGTINEIAHKLAGAEIDIEFVYASTGAGPETTIILSTSDNVRAAEIL
jgi:hypothetical protein